jgi:hypothetical protein
MCRTQYLCKQDSLMLTARRWLAAYNPQVGFDSRHVGLLIVSRKKYIASIYDVSI